MHCFQTVHCMHTVHCMLRFRNRVTVRFRDGVGLGWV